jgi:2-oxoglutarate dehydrogenase E2 component (dihydrolipoamide succinyltransferase)
LWHLTKNSTFSQTVCELYCLVKKKLDFLFLIATFCLKIFFKKMAEIKVPPLGESISEATIASIVKKVGSSIKTDELLIELETDKVTLEINAPCNGTIESLSIKEGDTVTVGQIIGQIKEGAGAVLQTPKQEEKPLSPVSSQPVSQAHALAPSVNRIVNENNVNANEISGTGKDGRITKGDAIAHLEQPKVSQPSTVTNNSSVERKDEIVRMTKLRQTVAKRLKDSQNTAAILTTFNEIDMSGIMDLRKQYQDDFQKRYGIKLGFMSFFVKACVVALKEIPAVNAEIKDNNIVYHNYCDIGVAVGTENGLVVPVIKDADKMSIFELEKAVYDYGIKARDGQITLEDMKGGTFTISNGGVYGSLLSTPIINPPQSAILGMHSIQKRPVVVNDQIVIRPMMYTALSYDHRIIDGKEAVTFLIRIKQIIEDPTRLVLSV